MGSTGWIALDVLPVGENSFAYWSPDGAHILVVSPSFRGNRTAALVSADGAPIRSYDGADYAIWLDESKFLIVSYGQGTGDRPSNARLGTVDAPGLTGVDVPKGTALSNNHGSVAFFTSDFEYTNDCGFGCPVYNFRVWSDGATTDAHEGEPVAWSADGSQLFVLHDVRKLKSGTGAPAADDFIGWLEILALPNLQSVRRLPDTTVNDKVTMLDPTSRYLLYESFEDSPQRELAYVLDVTSGATSSFDVFQRSFAWDGQQHVVVGPRMTDPSTTYDSTGQPISIVPARGTATLRDLQAQPVDSWSNVGQLVAGAPDGSAVALSDEEFTDARSFVSEFRNGQRTDIEPLPVDGYIATYCGPAALAPGGGALAVSCMLIERGADAGYGVTFLHPL